MNINDAGTVGSLSGVRVRVSFRVRVILMSIHEY